MPFHQEGKTMKKIAIVFLVIAAFLCLTACSQDQYAKLGELMGKMSGNVYGIKPNMKDVDAATDKVDGTVKVDDKGEVTVGVKSDDARSIVDSVIAVKDSSTKKEALQESLGEPILGKDATDKQKAEVKSQLTAQAETSKIDTTGFTPARKELADVVNGALAAVGASLSANPTKGELATFATLKKAIDALTITAEAAGIDLFADANITDLINNIMERGISRDGEESGIAKWLPVVSKSVTSIINCMTEDGRFSAQRYSKFIMECRTIRAAFEMMAREYAVEGDIDAILKKNIDLGLTIESLGKYVMAVVFVEMNDLSTPEAGEEIAVVPFLNKYVTDNYGKLTNLQEEYKNLPDPMADGSPYAAEFEHAMVAIANKIGIVTTEYKDFDKLIEEIRENLDKDGSLSKAAFNSLSVTGMILVDSEYTSILSMGEMDGTLSSLQKLITGKEVNK